MRSLSPALLLSLCLSGATGAAQGAPWQTITTPHYAIHHQEDPLAPAVAARVESIHGLLEARIGHALSQRVDVILENPMLSANGLAIAHLRHPTVVLWTEAPESDSELGHGAQWLDTLIIHELVHIHHLSIPAKQAGWLDTLGQWVGMGPLARKAPPWVIEGYATLLEGQLSGSGRPHGSDRARVLRERARAGRLPPYAQLNTFDPATQSGTPYLMGSAFLEWLASPLSAVPESKRADQPLPALWQQLANGKHSQFDQAFSATFGESPQVAYGRFCAHLTHTAVELEQRAPHSVPGKLWRSFPQGVVRHLAVSPNGKHLLGLCTSGEPSGLLVWRLQGASPALPEMSPQPHYRLASKGFGVPVRPRWDDTGAIRFERREADQDGGYHWREDQWQFAAPTPPQSNPIRIVTPHRQANGWGLPLTPTLTLPFEPWGPVAWDSQRGVLYAAVVQCGIPNLMAFPFDPQGSQPFGPGQPLTNTLSGTAYPAPTPDGKRLFFTQLTAWGTDIRVMDLPIHPSGTPPTQPNPAPTPLTPDTVLPPPDKPSLVAVHPTPFPDQPYAGLSHHQWVPALGGLTGPGQSLLLLGLSGNDVVGQWRWLAQSGWSSKPSPALSGAMVWQPARWAYGLHLFHLPRAQQGIECSLTRPWLNVPFAGALQLHLGAETRDHQPRRHVGMGLTQQAGWNHHLSAVTVQASAHCQLGQSNGHSWRLHRQSVALLGSHNNWHIQFQGEWGQLFASPQAEERFTIGGQSQGFLPLGVEATHVLQAALPPQESTGNRFFRLKAESHGLYWEALHAAHQTLNTVGYVYSQSVAHFFPHLRPRIRYYIGNPRFSAGIHRILTGMDKGQTVFTASLTYRP